MKVLPGNQLDNYKYVLQATFTKMQLGAINYWRKWGKLESTKFRLPLAQEGQIASQRIPCPPLPSNGWVLLRPIQGLMFVSLTWEDLKLQLFTTDINTKWALYFRLFWGSKYRFHHLKQCSASCARDLKTVLSRIVSLLVLLSTSLF